MRHARAVHHCEGTKENDTAHREITLAEAAEVDQRMAGAHLSHNQQDQPDNEQDQERLRPSERIGEPIPFPALAEQDFPTAHCEHQQRQADVVEIEWPATEFASLLLEILGVIDDGIRAYQCKQPNWDVDEEDPPPAVVDAKPAAQRRPKNWCDNRGQSEQGHGRTLLFLGKFVQENALATRLEPAAGQPLDDAK